MKYGKLSAALFTGADSWMPFSKVGTVLRLVMIGYEPCVACCVMVVLPVIRSRSQEIVACKDVWIWFWKTWPCSLPLEVLIDHYV